MEAGHQVDCARQGVAAEVDAGTESGDGRIETVTRQRVGMFGVSQTARDAHHRDAQQATVNKRNATCGEVGGKRPAVDARLHVTESSRLTACADAKASCSG
jgi:hypothetical protein